MTRRKSSPAKPWSKKKAAKAELAIATPAAAPAERRPLTENERWALAICRRILIDCHTWQRGGAIDPAHRISFLVGRGGTKTTTLRARAMLKILLLPNQYVGYAATSAPQARTLNWGPLKRICAAYGITTTGANPDVTFHDSTMLMTCTRTGSTYQLRGVEDTRDAEKFRGFPQAEFQVDECGSFPPTVLEYLCDECVAPRLGEGLTFPEGFLERLADPSIPLDELAFEPVRGGCMALASTPPRRTGGIFYDVTRPGSDKHRPYEKRNEPEFKDYIGYSSHAWNLRQVCALPDAAVLYPALVALLAEQELEFKRKGWDENHPKRKREYDGLWSEDNTTNVFHYKIHVDGKPWNQWSPFGEQYIEGLEGTKIALAKLPKNVGTWHFGVALDSGGTRDPFAINAFAFAPADPWRRLIHVYGLERMRMHGKPIATVLIGENPEKHPGEPLGACVFNVLGWPDVLELDGDQALIDELANVYGIQCKKSERKADYKFSAIELVNGDTDAAAPDGDFPGAKIWVLKGSPLEQQMQTLQWKTDEYGILTENKAQANHCTDTLIYVRGGVATLFDTGRVTEEADAATSPAAAAAARPELAGIRGQQDEDDQLAGFLSDPTYDDDDPW